MDDEAEAPFDFAAELAELLGTDEDDDEPTPDPTPKDVQLSSREQTDLDLISLAADQAVLEAQAASERASRDKADKAMARLRERREELLAVQNNPELADSADAAGAVSKRIQQLVAELDMSIETLEAAGPFVHLGDEDLGAYETERTIDPASGMELNRYTFTEATGSVGDAVRQLEDAELAFGRVLSERLPELAAKPDLTIHEKALELRLDQQIPLRVRDALTKLDEAQARVDGMAGEITRRKAERQLRDHYATEAVERARAKATALDEQKRKAILTDTSLSPEDRAVELGRLQAPMGERAGAKEQWSELLADAKAKVAEEGRQIRLRQRLHTGVFLKDDPLMRFLAAGDRMEVSEYEDGQDGRRGYKARSPAEAAALRALGGVEGLSEARGEAAMKTAQEEFNDRVHEAMALQAEMQQKQVAALMGDQPK